MTKEELAAAICGFLTNVQHGLVPNCDLDIQDTQPMHDEPNVIGVTEPGGVTFFVEVIEA